jgi:hypothetical protein
MLDEQLPAKISQILPNEVQFTASSSSWRGLVNRSSKFNMST